jgi:tetratricopeptide (TPR) repeat protein
MRLFVLVALLTAVGVATPARADNPVLAREHFKKGTALYDMGKYAEAAAEYQLAFEAKEDVALLFNIAQAHRLAGHLDDALGAYKGYLRRVPQAKNRVEVEQRMKDLQDAIDKKRAEDDRLAQEKAEQERLEKERAAAAQAAAAAAQVVVATPPPPKPRPVYKKWWLWTAVGGGVVALGLGVGLGVGLTRDRFDASLGRVGPGALKVTP